MTTSSTRSTATGPGGVTDELAVLQSLAEVGAAFTNERRLEPVLDRLLAAALQISQAQAGSIMLLSRTGESLTVVAARGPRADTILGTTQSADRSVAGSALQTKHSVLVHGGASNRSDFPQDLSSAAVVPLSVSGRVVGVLNVSREIGAPRITENTRRLLELLAHQASILVDNAQMMEELQRKEERLEQLVDQLLTESGRQPVTPAGGRAPYAPLTPREQQVLELLVEGLTNREIGGHLIVEPDTVKDHVQSIIKKLGAADRTHAAVIAVRTGLIS
jgi:DNA-binding NarL/FixJ family response regulator